MIEWIWKPLQLIKPLQQQITPLGFQGTKLKIRMVSEDQNIDKKENKDIPRNPIYDIYN